jgi:hypothetical protein
MAIDAARVVRFVLIVFVAAASYAQTPQPQRDPSNPDFRVEVWGDIGIEFVARVESYAQLRSELEKGLPPLRVTVDPAEIRRAERALARRIRDARRKAKRGDIFTPAISGLFRNTLLLEMDAKTWKSVMDDNPGAFPVRINGTYPDKRPLSTVPGNILAVLPRLPNDVQYRFLGPHLVLFDTRARVVLDGIPYAIKLREGR